MSEDDTPTITRSNNNLTPAAIAVLEQAASAQFGLRLRYCPEQFDPLDPPRKPQQAKDKKPKNSPTNKPTPKANVPLKKPPSEKELHETILEAAKAGPVKSAQFYTLWPDEDRSRASKVVLNAMKVLIMLGKLTQHGNRIGTAYSLVA